MLLDKASAKPLYVQMEELFWGKLDSGEWSPGALIPSENELSHMYGISRTTVRNVITKLVQEEVLFRLPGKGTYVAVPQIVAQSLSYAGLRDPGPVYHERDAGQKDLCQIFRNQKSCLFCGPPAAVSQKDSS